MHGLVTATVVIAVVVVASVETTDEVVGTTDVLTDVIVTVGEKVVVVT